MEIRTLRADEIDCRIGQCKDDGLSLLLYKDARCDMNILDEVFGPMNWKRRHARDNANCIVSIWDESKHEWIEKEDTGTESNTEAEKGLASDSFKRACVNVGIGRELYTAPFIWVSAADCNINNRKCYDKFSVTDIGYDAGRNINRLTIVNRKNGKTVYVMGKQQKKEEPQKKEESREAPMMTCECCGSVIRPYKDKNGKEWGIREHQELSKAKFNGQTFCINCIKSGRVSK